ncbi:hypothetical protein B0H11DRAFT_1348245 [Mycena galericulata]|nr:hypothetical protein B0H11DRAFT_1348245 [Mycena galericulata]
MIRPTCEAAPGVVDSWMGHRPPRRLASGTAREKHNKCKAPPPKISFGSQQSLARRTVSGVQGAPQLGSMHVLVPSDDTGYNVFAEDTYDGVPPICCLEDVLNESEGIVVLTPDPQSETGWIGLGNPAVQQNEEGLRVKPPSVPREPEIPGGDRIVRICKREPSQEALLSSLSLWRAKTEDHCARKAVPKSFPHLQETSEVSTRETLFSPLKYRNLDAKDARL